MNTLQLVETFAEVPNYIIKLCKLLEQEITDSSMLKVVKMLEEHREFWGLYCTLVNFQVNLSKVLIPMQSGLVQYIKKNHNGSFLKLMMDSQENQRKTLESFKWTFTTVKNKKKQKKGWQQHSKFKIKHLLCILNKLKQFRILFCSLTDYVREIYKDSSPREFLEVFIGIWHDRDLCKDCKLCANELEQKKMANYVFNRPDIPKQSCAKKYLLYLRWMVRRTPDLFLWRFYNPKDLIAPIDLHVQRIGYRLGILDKEEGCSWNDVEKMTEFYKRVNPDDPLAIDLAVSRIGILGICNKEINKCKCVVCILKSQCKVGKDVEWKE